MTIHRTIDSRFNALAAAGGWPVTCDAALSFEHDELRRLHEAWARVAAGRAAPAKQDFSPRALGGLLRQLTFIDRIADGAGGARYQFRFFGSALSAVNGDMTGRYLDEIVPEPHLQSWVAAYDFVLSTLRPLRFRSAYKVPELSHLRAESYAAPLVDGNGRPSGLLTASIFGPR